MILNDFDEIKTSTFDPYEVENIIPDFPKIGISCFSYKIIEKLVNLFNGKQITYLSNANGKYQYTKLRTIITNMFYLCLMLVHLLVLYNMRKYL